MNDERPEGHPDTRPYLSIPYWTTPLGPGGSWDTGRDLGAAGPLNAERVAAEPGEVAATLWLLDDGGAQVGEAGRRVRTTLRLGPLEARRFQVLIDVEHGIRPGRSGALEAILVDQAEERVAGALGMALLGP